MTAPRTKPTATRSKFNARSPHVATHAVVKKQGDEIARKLYAAFHEFNRSHFQRRLAAPLILITQSKSARTQGDYSPRDVHGLDSRIRIAPATITPKKGKRAGEKLALDVLLHEMIHAWQHEVIGDLEPGYRGHGPRFASMCNQIGAKLGLPPVGVKGRDGLPDCAYWPENVRPAGYYPAPFVKPTRDDGKTGAEGEGDSEGEEKAPRAAPAAERARKLLAQLGALVPELSGCDDDLAALRDGAAELVAALGRELGESDEGEGDDEAA